MFFKKSKLTHRLSIDKSEFIENGEKSFLLQDSGKDGGSRILETVEQWAKAGSENKKTNEVQKTGALETREQWSKAGSAGEKSDAKNQDENSLLEIIEQMEKAGAGGKKLDETKQNEGSLLEIREQWKKAGANKIESSGTIPPKLKTNNQTPDFR